MHALTRSPRVVPAEDGVAVHIPAEDLLPDLLEALGGSAFLLAQAARFRQAGSFEARLDALEHIATNSKVARAVELRLTPEAAARLSFSLQAVVSTKARAS